MAEREQVKGVSPSKFMRELRPEFYSDTSDRTAYQLDASALEYHLDSITSGTVAKLAMRQRFVLFKGLTFQKLCLPGAFRPGDHHNKMLRPG
ncbi:hypothetical protein G7N32_26035, partial [Escherichia coli]|nr:hypothetical protein [Escherichia coli]